MRRKDKEMTRRSDIDDVLRRALVLHLGLVDDGRAYVVPVDFGYDGTALYIHSAQEGRKVSVLRRNPRVFFQVEIDHVVVLSRTDTCHSTSRFRSVMGEGAAVFLDDPLERRRGLDIVMSKFAPAPFDYNEARLAKVAVIRIDIESITGKSHGF